MPDASGIHDDVSWHTPSATAGTAGEASASTVDDAGSADTPAKRRCVLGGASPGKQARVPLILDVDTGVDDALALLLALRCPAAEVLAVTCVNGNVGVDQVVRNTLLALDAAGAPSDLPVARGFEEPLVQPVQRCPQIHGDDGMGDLSPALPPSSRQPRPEHATELLNATLAAASQRVTVVALAPLTNIAVAIRIRPALWREKVERIVWMGGAIAGGGNATQWGEANAAYDPEAAHIVMSSGVPLMLYPWDVYLKVGYTKDELEAMGLVDGPHGAGVDSAASMAARLMHRDMRHFSVPEAMLGDAGAVAAVLLGGGATTTRRLHVSVELQGARTRGMTVADLRSFSHPPDAPIEQANAEVVMDVDAAAIKRLFSGCVLGARAPASA